MNIKFYINKKNNYKIFQYGKEGKEYFDLFFKDKENRFIYNLRDIYILIFFSPEFFLNLFYYRSFKLSYFKTLFSILKVKTVITWLDNNGTYQELDKKFKDIKFFTFQNGFRSHLCLTEKKIYHSNFICFGKNDVDRYKKYGHEVKNFLPYGSLKLNLVLDKINSREKEFTNQINENEIAFISEMPMKFMQNNNQDFDQQLMWPLSRMKSLMKLIYFTREFIKKNKQYKLKILMRSIKDSKFYEIERKFFLDQFGSNINFSSNDGTVTRNYFSALKSNLIIGMKSTLLCELYGIGKKIVSFSFGYNKNWSIPINTFNITNNKINYLEFEKIIYNVLKMNNEEYLNLSKIDRNYLMTDYPGYALYKKEVFKKINGL